MLHIQYKRCVKVSLTSVLQRGAVCLVQRWTCCCFEALRFLHFYKVLDKITAEHETFVTHLFCWSCCKVPFLKKLVMVRKERQKLNLTQFWGTFLEPSCCPWKVGISKWEKGSSDFSVFTCFQLGKSGYSKQHDKNDIKCCSQSCTDQDQVMSRDQDKICTRVCQGKAESNRGLGL